MTDRFGVLADFELGMLVESEEEEIQQVVQVDLPICFGVG